MRLAQETINLLDRLFNLKGDENVVLKGIEEEIKNNKGLIEAESDAQTHNEIAKVDAEGKLSVFETQKGIFEGAFSGLDDETFSALREIGVDIQIGTMLETISLKAPDFCDGLKKQIEDYEFAISENKKRKDELSSELEKLQETRTHSLEDQEKLISLLEQSMSPDEAEREALSTSYVKKILSLFDLFNSDEINTLTKLIIFPDDGLYEFADSYEERLKNGLVNITDETDGFESEKELETEESDKDSLKAASVYEDVQNLPVIDSNNPFDAPVSDDIHEDIVKKDIMNQETTAIDLSSLNALMDDKDLVPLEKIEDEEETAEIEDVELPLSVDDSEKENDEEESSQDDSIETYLSSIGLDIEKLKKYSDKSVDEILGSFEKIEHSLINGNYEILRSINVSEEAIYSFFDTEQGLMFYLTDKDLNKKITLLRAKSVSEQVIKSMIEDKNSGFAESYESLENKIKLIESSIGRIDDENIKMISENVLLYADNCRELALFGLELDDQELRNNRGLLMATNNVADDLRLLKSYLISLVRKNGKYALTPFWKTQRELLNDIDDLIEADLDGIIEFDPDVLGLNTLELIKRVKYCLNNGISIVDENDKTMFADYIIDFYKFDKEFGNKIDVLVEDRKLVNEKLPEIIGNTDVVKTLVDILNEYYDKSSEIVDIDLGVHEQAELSDLKSKFVDNLKAISNGVYAYKLGDILISKNKFERQLGILISEMAVRDMNSSDCVKEMLLTAALYNGRFTEDAMKTEIGRASCRERG